jgi:hypothetical protein
MPDTDRWSATDGVMNALSASAVAGAVLFEIVARANGLGGPYWTFFSPDVFVQCGLLSVFVYHAWRVHDWRETVAALVLAAIAFPLIRSAGFSFVRSQTQALAYAAMVGSGGVQLAALVRAFGVAGQRMLRLRLARDSVMIAAGVSLPTPVLGLSMAVNPVLDHLVAQLDDAFGVRLISVVRWSVSLTPYAEEGLHWVYGSVPIAVALCYALQRATLPAVPLTVWLASVIGFAMYFHVPVVGPPHTFPHYYASFWPSADAEYDASPHAPVGVPRNCMPSLHAVWAYLIVFATRGLRRAIRSAAFAYAALTLVAAIEIGRHWFIDLVVAFPFAVAVQALVTTSIPLRTPERLAATVGGAALAAGLIGLMYAQPLRFPLSEAIHWLAMIVALAVAAVLWRRLARRVQPGPIAIAAGPVGRPRSTNDAA